MAQETRPLPKITLTALQLLQAAITQQIEVISQQTLEVLGLNVADGWRVDAQAGTISRTVPDAPEKPTLVA